MPKCVTHASPAQTTCDDAAPTVLIIDDDLAVLESLEMVLKAAGFRVLTARNGWEGLRVFRQHAPAVVVTDIMMPEQDGIGTMLQMRRERPNVKVIVMSGGGYIDTWDYLTTARELGADATFRKSLDTDALVEKLGELLR